MRGNEAHKLILEDQIDGSLMEARVARIESDIAMIQVDVREVRTDMRELRTDMKAANEAIADLRVSVTALDGKADATNARLDALGNNVELRFDALNAKVDANQIATRAGFAEVNKSISELRGTVADLCKIARAPSRRAVEGDGARESMPRLRGLAGQGHPQAAVRRVHDNQRTLGETNHAV